LNAATQTSDLIGTEVKTPQGRHLGEVKDLLVDLESGRLVVVILGVDDFQIAVPPSVLREISGGHTLMVLAGEERLRAAPRFIKTQWAQDFDSRNLSAIYRYYGKTSSFGYGRSEEKAVVSQKGTDALRTSDQAWKNKDSSRGRVSIEPGLHLNRVESVSQLLGMRVNNLQQLKLGQLVNVLVNLPAGRVVAVVLSSGDFLGMGRELSAVPPTAIRINIGQDTLRLDATKEMLSRSPHYQGDQWPEALGGEKSHSASAGMDIKDSDDIPRGLRTDQTPSKRAHE
jgi:sporulation protein YlmC with PRC-barrel domain